MNLDDSNKTGRAGRILAGLAAGAITLGGCGQADITSDPTVSSGAEAAVSGASGASGQDEAARRSVNDPYTNDQIPPCSDEEATIARMELLALDGGLRDVRVETGVTWRSGHHDAVRLFPDRFDWTAADPRQLSPTAVARQALAMAACLELLQQELDAAVADRDSVTPVTVVVQTGQGITAACSADPDRQYAALPASEPPVSPADILCAEDYPAEGAGSQCPEFVEAACPTRGSDANP